MSLRLTKKRKVAFEQNEQHTEDLENTRPVKKSVIGKLKAGRTKPISDKLAEVADKEEASTSSSTFTIVAGSYEKLLYGLEGSLEGEEINIKPVFIFPAHISCVRALGASPHGGRWLATGSTDEIIKVWDLRRRKEVGGLVQHEGSITQLSFPTRTHMFSASEDGTITIFRVKDWVPLRVLKGHKGRVNFFAVHPSLKVALSVGKDGTLRTWDLKKGKTAASVKLGKEGEVVRWSMDGKHFAITSGKEVELYSTSMSLMATIKHPSRIHDIRFLDLADGRECLLVAAEDHNVSVYTFEPGNESGMSIWAQFTGHKNRVKSIDILKVSAKTLLTSVSSDGLIHLYDTGALLSGPSTEKTLISPTAQYDTKGTRLTCVTFAGGPPPRLPPPTTDGTEDAEQDSEDALEN